jgi:hypothetical protein
MTENHAFTQFTPTLRVMPTCGCSRIDADRPSAGTRPDPRPWAIVLRRFPEPPHIIGQFRNRQDAEDQLRALRRLVPQGDFELVFLPPDEPSNG